MKNKEYGLWKKQEYKENRNNLVMSIEEAKKQVIKNKIYTRILGDCKRSNKLRNILCKKKV